MKIRCNNCMSVFYEQFVKHHNEEEICPCCSTKGCLMDVPEEEFPQYYDNSPKEIDNRLPNGYAEVEYKSEQLESDPEAIEGARWDDRNYQRYMER